MHYLKALAERLPRFAPGCGMAIVYAQAIVVAAGYLPSPVVTRILALVEARLEQQAEQLPLRHLLQLVAELVVVQ